MYTLEMITHNMSKLSTTEIDELFSMLTEHSDILFKIVPDMPLIKYIATGKYDTAYEGTISVYDEWKKLNKTG